MFQRSNGNVVYDGTNSRAFKILSANFSPCCNMFLYKTQENLVLTFDARAKALNTSEVDLASMHELLLSENDGSALKVSLAMKAIKRRLCEQLSLFLKILSFQHNKVVSYKDNSGNDLIFLAKYGQIFLPNCQKSKRQWVYDQKRDSTKYMTPEEFNGLAVEAKVYQKDRGTARVNGRWVSHKIIVYDHEEVYQYQKSYNYFFDPISKMIIHQDHNRKTLEFISTQGMISVKDLVSYAGTEFNFNHYSNLLHEVDLYDQFVRKEEIIEKYNSEFKQTLIQNSVSDLKKIGEVPTNIFSSSNWEKYVSIIKLSIYAISFVALIVLFAISFRCVILRRRKTKQKQRSRLIKEMFSTPSAPLRNIDEAVFAKTKLER